MHRSEIGAISKGNNVIMKVNRKENGSPVLGDHNTGIKKYSSIVF
jgi:hypothetical protein